MTSIPPNLTPDAIQPAPPSPAEQQMQGLPPTGLQQQMQSLNRLYEGAQNARGNGTGNIQARAFGANVTLGGNARRSIGFDPRKLQYQQGMSRTGGQLSQAQLEGGDTSEMGAGATSLDVMARDLAQRWGLPIGKGRLVDDQGNFMYTPQQLADASGGRVTLGEAAAQMNYISQALTNRRNEQQQQKGISALTTGLSLVQSRGRGSMAGMMSGYYEGIADLYANQEYEAADFSFYIQKEQQDIAAELRRRQEKLLRKMGRANAIGGIAMVIGGALSGDYATVGQGINAVAVGGTQGGWW